MIHRATVVAVSLFLTVSCMDADGYDDVAETSQKLQTIEFERWPGEVGELFRDVRTPVAILTTGTDGRSEYTVMFGVDGDTGVTLFAYTGSPRDFDQMFEASASEGAAMLSFVTDKIAPKVPVPKGGGGPGNGDFIPANKTLGLSIAGAKEEYFGWFDDLEGKR